MQPERTNVIVCPRCGEENIEGSDSCANCLADFPASGAPANWEPVAESDLQAPLSKLRLRPPATIAPTAIVRDAISLLQGEPGGGLVVLDDGRIAGIFTERDVLKKIAGRGARIDDPVSRHMTPDPVTLRVDDSMAVALNKMGVGGFRHIPVTRDGALVGLVTARDLMSWMMGRFFD